MDKNYRIICQIFIYLLFIIFMKDSAMRQQPGSLWHKNKPKVLNVQITKLKQKQQIAKNDLLLQFMEQVPKNSSNATVYLRGVPIQYRWFLVQKLIEKYVEVIRGKSVSFTIQNSYKNAVIKEAGIRTRKNSLNSSETRSEYTSETTLNNQQIISNKVKLQLTNILQKLQANLNTFNESSQINNNYSNGSSGIFDFQAQLENFIRKKNQEFQRKLQEKNEQIKNLELMLERSLKDFNTEKNQMVRKIQEYQKLIKKKQLEQKQKEKQRVKIEEKKKIQEQKQRQRQKQRQKQRQRQKQIKKLKQQRQKQRQKQKQKKQERQKQEKQKEQKEIQKFIIRKKNQNQNINLQKRTQKILQQIQQFLKSNNSQKTIRQNLKNKIQAFYKKTTQIFKQVDQIGKQQSSQLDQIVQFSIRRVFSAQPKIPKIYKEDLMKSNQQHYQKKQFQQKIQIKQLQSSTIHPYSLIFMSQSEIFQNTFNSPKEVSSLFLTTLFSQIEKFALKKIYKLKFIFKFNPITPEVNPLKLINKLPNILLIGQLKNNRRIIGGFSDHGINPGIVSRGFIFSSDEHIEKKQDLRVFKMSQKFSQKSVATYENYYINFGNSDLRIKLGTRQLFFKQNQTLKVDDFLKCEQSRDAQLEKYEFYQITFI